MDLNKMNKSEAIKIIKKDRLIWRTISVFKSVHESKGELTEAKILDKTIQLIRAYDALCEYDLEGEVANESRRSC